MTTLRVYGNSGSHGCNYVSHLNPRRSMNNSLSSVLMKGPGASRVEQDTEIVMESLLGRFKVKDT